jgi:hypothetical protein
MNGDGDADGGDDLGITDILFQFIPFYGQGDSSNDSTVRAALSSLSIQDIDSKDDSGNTLLLLACMYRCEDLVRIMLNKGADPNAVNASGACCLHFACYGETSSMAIAKGLLQNGANPEVQETTYGCTPLHYCASCGNVEFCKLLLSHGALVNTADYSSRTCVDYARQSGMADAAVFLQQKLDKHVMQYQYGNQFHQYGNQQEFGSFGIIGGALNGNNVLGCRGSNNLDGWTAHFDESSQQTYYVSSSTGESLWEYDWKMRTNAVGSRAASEASVAVTPIPAVAVAGGSGRNAVAAVNAASKSTAVSDPVTKDTAKICLLDFMGRYDKTRVSEVEDLLSQYAGQEMQLMKDLCARYSANENAEIKKFHTKYIELKEKQQRTNGKSDGPVAGNEANSSVAKAGSLGFLKNLSVSTKESTTNVTPSKPPPASPSHRQHRGNSTTSGYDSNYVAAVVTEEKNKLEAQMTAERNEFHRILKEKEDAMSAINSELSTFVKRRDEVQV